MLKLPAFFSYGLEKILPAFFLLIAVQPASSQKLGFIIPATDCPRSQHQADIWYFGDHAGIDFRSGTATVLTNEDVMTAFKSSAVMSDSTGNLLFFTNGNKAWDNTFSQMPNATNLEGDLGVGQPCLIVPIPGDSSRYIIFTIDLLAFLPDNSYTTNGLRYTVMDMKLNNGKGDALGDSLNNPLLTPVSQKLTATYDEGSKVYWVLAHKWGTDEFYAYPVSKDGLGDPVISSSGSVHGGGFAQQANALGYMKFSPDGKKVALAISGLNTVELFSFSSSSGKVSGASNYTFTKPGVSPYGIEFSPDNKKLYVSLLQLTGNGPPAAPSYICQFDLLSGLTNPIFLDSLAGIRTGALQVATDGRIYASRTVNLLSKKDSIEVIYNPTRPGLKCNLNQLNHVGQSRFPLSGRTSIYSLPNFVQSYFNIPVFTYDSICLGDITKFHITNKANIDNVLWNFGDGSTSALTDPVHQYAQPGTYNVKLTETFNGENFTDSVPLTIYPLPAIGLGDTILLYSGSTINLHAGGGNMEYTWSTGSADSIISVSKQGDYWVKVLDHHCCRNTDSVYVKVFQYFIPNAFSPNGDGINDVFRMIGLYKNIKFSMMVYDRWGTLVFRSENMADAWDGTYKNSPCPAASYMWLINIDFLGQDIVTQGSVQLKGSVVIVR
jgi:gliding motility-associated-like protein